VGSYPLYILIASWYRGMEANWSLVVLGLGMLALVVFTHRSNIQRLMSGTEDRNKWFDKLRKG